ncbi:hypothetical protein ASF23_12925 [Curtobacterium sp. Leaf261]|nr:hypothetical protein ASF23_12925 [Curtobacterium sp. Leaf261]
MISQVPPPVHGQAVMTVRFLEAVEELGHPVRFVDRRFSRTVDEVGAPSIRKAAAAAGLLLRTFRTVLTWRPTVTVFFVTTRPISFIVDWALSEVLRLGRGRRVFYVHSVGFVALARRNAVWRSLVRRFLGSASQVVCLGPSLTSDVLPFVRTDRVQCIPNTPGSVPGPASAASDTATVLFMSNFIAGKGADVFARIAGLLAARDDAWRFVMAGHAGDDATAAVIDDAVASSGVAGALDRPGALGGAAKWAALRGARCLAFTSELTEAQPLTIIEALASGTPVVAFRLGGIPDIVQDGVNGFLVEPGDEAGFADRVAMLLTDDDLRAGMSHAARARFEGQHSATEFASHWGRLIGEVTA